jgi:hypothetical protein
MPNADEMVIQMEALGGSRVEVLFAPTQLK